MARRLTVACITTALALGIGLAGSASGSAASKDTTAEQDLAGHVPASVADTCEGYTPGMKKYVKHLSPKAKPIAKQIAAAVKCTPDPSLGADAVVHVQFKTDSSLDKAYALLLARLQLPPGTKAITEGTCPVEGAFGDPQQGRVGCVPSTSAGAAEVVWATFESRILSDALRNDDIIGQSILGFFKGPDSGPV